MSESLNAPINAPVNAVKNFLAAIAHYSPWPIHRLSRRRPASETLEFLGTTAAGILIGVLCAAIFMLASMVLPARVALLISLCVGLAGAIPRAGLGVWAQALNPQSSLILGVLVLLKLEILSEIDLEWIPVTLICSAAWARAAVLAATPAPIVGLHATTTPTRLAMLLIGMLPLCFFGVWPEPVWGLWVAGLVALIAARWVKARTSMGPVGVRWVLVETIYCLVVLLLMSAATISEMAQEETPGS